MQQLQHPDLLLSAFFPVDGKHTFRVTHASMKVNHLNDNDNYIKYISFKCCYEEYSLDIYTVYGIIYAACSVGSFSFPPTLVCRDRVSVCVALAVRRSALTHRDPPAEGGRGCWKEQMGQQAQNR